jgi:hypothetical protein
MILKIALGIVLAVIILAFWEVILGLGLILMVAAIVLIAAGLIILWTVSDLGSFGIVIAITGGIFLITWSLESRKEKAARHAQLRREHHGEHHEREQQDQSRHMHGLPRLFQKEKELIEEQRRARDYDGSHSESGKRS